MLIFSLFLITVVVGENSENYGESYDRDYESAYSDPLQRLCNQLTFYCLFFDPLSVNIKLRFLALIFYSPFPQKFSKMHFSRTAYQTFEQAKFR